MSQRSQHHTRRALLAILVAWTKLTSGTTADLMSISFASDTIGWAVGVGGVILKSLNGGNGWTRQGTAITEDLLAVKAVSTSTVYADGRGWRGLQDHQRRHPVEEAADGGDHELTGSLLQGGW